MIIHPRLESGRILWQLGLRRLTPLAVAAAVMGVYALYVFWRLRITGSDPSFFVVAGPLATDPTHTLPNLHVFSGATYDGQFFYRLALEPWTSVQTAYGITLDVPAYRQQRILYPLLAWAVSAGMWRLVPAALIVVNLLAVGALAYATARFAVAAGRSALASVLVPFYPGYAVTISRDLGELAEAALLVIGLVLLNRRRFWFAAAALSAGALAKETLLGVPVAGLIGWAIRRARRQGTAEAPPVAVWLAPLGVYALWSLIMLSRWGTTGFGQGSVNFSLPMAALGEHLATLATPDWRANRVEIGLLILIAAAAMWVIAGYRTRLLSGAPIPLASVLYAAIAVFYASYIWHDDYAYSRALHELFVCASLALLTTSVWAPRILGLATLGLWWAFVLQIGPAP